MRYRWNRPHSTFRFEPPRDNSWMVDNSEGIIEPDLPDWKLPTPSMRRPVSVKPFFHLSLFSFLFFISSFSKLFPLRQAASVAILLSALFGERFSLGASWVYSIQQVLLPDNRPLLPSLEGKLGQELDAVT